MLPRASLRSDLVLGVDIGGTKIAAALVDHAGRISSPVRRVPTPAGEGPTAVLAAVAAVAEAVLTEPGPGLAGSGAVAACGVASAGTFDPGGTVVAATDHLAGWTGTPVAADLGERLGLRVRVLNDVHAAALAEARFGPPAERLLYVAVGTGIGGAFVRSGTLDVGPHGSAGAIGHTDVAGSSAPCACGRSGHLEPLACGPGLEEEYLRRTGRAPGLREVGRLARAGDPVAAAVIRDGARALGRGLASAASLLDPDRVVLSGGVSELGRPWWSAVDGAYRAAALPGPASTPLAPATLRTDSPIVGAALFALDPPG